jgi:hypothetical protein
MSRTKEEKLARRRELYPRYSGKVNEARRAERAADPAKVRARENETRRKRAARGDAGPTWRSRHPEKAKAHDTLKRFRKHGLTETEYTQMIRRQFGRCLLCEVEFSTLPRSKIAIDHCHRTGKVRGILCFACNLFIGHAREDVLSLQRAIRYLELALEEEGNAS